MTTEELQPKAVEMGIGGLPVPTPPPRRRKGDTAPTGIVVVIPAFNEERFIGSTVLLTRRYAGDVIVVDDGSSDHTAELAEIAGATVICQPQNAGKGAALSTGILAALQLDPQVIALMDADFQHLPEELPRLIAPILADNADVVIGSRYLQPLSKVPFSRILGHRLFNWLTYLASGAPATDSQSGFRAFSAAAAKKLAFHAEGFAVESEMQFLIRQHQLRVTEVPITIQYLDPPKRSLWVHGMRVLNGLIRLVAQYRPLLFFGAPGVLLITAGLGGGLWVVQRFNAVQQLATGTALISVLLIIIGLTFFSTGIILHSVRALIVDHFRSRNMPR